MLNESDGHDQIPWECLLGIVNIKQAQAHLPQLVDRVAAGEEVILSRGGDPIVRITRLVEAKPRVRFGILMGRIGMGEDFDSPLPSDELARFERA